MTIAPAVRTLAIKYQIFWNLTVVGTLVFIPVKLAIARSIDEFQIAQNPCESRDFHRGVASAQNACAVWMYEQGDRKLNQAYQQLQPELSALEKELLTDAQLAWIQFKDKQCDYQLYRPQRMGWDSSNAPIVKYMCLLGLTEELTTDLQAYIGGQMLPSNSGSYQVADGQLNQTYQRLVSHTNQTMANFNCPASSRPECDSANKLQSAQIAWIEFRDANCQFESDRFSRSDNACLTRVTEQRTEQLSKLLPRN